VFVTGRENDGTGLSGVEGGLYYYRARYYSPTLQRFISEDPIRFLGGINYYRYVDNNPVNFNDPYGLVDPLTLTLAALIVIDIVLNIDIQLDNQGGITVTIPPPSMFEDGVPLPFPFGVHLPGEVIDVPIIGSIGVPTGFGVLVDLNFMPSPPSAEAAEPPEMPNGPGGGGLSGRK